MSKSGKIPYSAMKFLYDGGGHDLTMSAEGLKLKFHRFMIEACSPVLTAALEIEGKKPITPETWQDTAVFNLELKCSMIVLRDVRNIMYGIRPTDEKMPLLQAWDAYCFAEQYEIKFIIEYIAPALNRMIVKTTIDTLVELLKQFTTDTAKPFVEPAVAHFKSIVYGIGREHAQCSDVKLCCRHGGVTCFTQHCCTHRLLLSVKAREYRRVELSKIYAMFLTLPAHIQEELFCALV